MAHVVHSSDQIGIVGAVHAAGGEPATSRWSLQLLNSWRLDLDCRPVTVTPRLQRLITALALRGVRCRRHYAGLLWPHSTDAKASGSLRACIWSISHHLPGLLNLDQDTLALRADVRVDHAELCALLMQVDDRSPNSVPPNIMAPEVSPDMFLRLRRAELLPGWYEDWLCADQERFRLLKLSALETVARTALARGDLRTAADAAASAIAEDPLRETAQRELLRVHLAAGNHALAVQAYEAYRGVLQRELGVRPSEMITSLIRPVFG